MERKKALITGASSGLGYQLSLILSKKYDYDLIVVARRRERLEQLAQEAVTNVEVIATDLADSAQRQQFLTQLADVSVDLVINNAGLGDCQFFHLSRVEKQRQMINVNILALMELTHFFLGKFINRNYGRIVNISSAAGFIEGPLMAGYYSSKNYVRVLTNSINHELKMLKSKVKISLVCPGPFESEFSQVANVDFQGILDEHFLNHPCEKIAAYTLKQVFKNKKVIVPGGKQKILLALSKITPSSLTRKIVAKYQQRKSK